MTAEFLEFELPNQENSINFEQEGIMNETLKACANAAMVVDELKCGEEE